MKTKTFFFFFVAIAVFSSKNLYAQDEDPQQIFAQNMQKAAALTKENQLPLALLKYLEIRQTFTGPELDYSIGRTYQRLHQCKEAIPYLQKTLEYPNLNEKHPVYSRTIESLANLYECSNWTTITLNCTTTDDETLYINDNPIGPCFFKNYTLPEGEYTFEIKSKNASRKLIKTIAVKSEPIEIDLYHPKEITEKISTKEINHYYRVSEKFSPILYWGLISGGSAILISSGFFASMGYNAKADIQKYKDRKLSDKQKSAESKLKTSKILTATSLGIGSAVLLTGITLAIISVNSKYEIKQTEKPLETFLAPTSNGLFVGFKTMF